MNIDSAFGFVPYFQRLHQTNYFQIRNQRLFHSAPTECAYSVYLVWQLWHIAAVRSVVLTRNIHCVWYTVL